MAIDSGYKIVSKFDLTDYNQPSEKTISLEVNQSLSEGDHTYYFYLKDNYDKQSQTVKYTYYYKHHTPVISNLRPVKPSFRNIYDQIQISGSVSDADGRGKITVSLILNNRIISEVPTPISSTSNYGFVFIYNNENNELVHGTNTFTVKATHDSGKSATKEVSFNFEYNRPELTLKNLQSTYSFTKNKDPKSLSVAYDIKDIDSNEVTIKYEIDTRGAADYTTHISQYSSVSLTDQSFTIDIPQDLSEGQHTVFVWAADEYLQSEHQPIKFNFAYNAPTISLSTNNRANYTNNIDTPIVIQGTVIDPDGSGSVTLTLFLENNTYDSQEIQISSTNPHEFQFTITNINNTLEEGNIHYNLTAKDETEKTSTISSSFDLSYSPPKLSASFSKQPAKFIKGQDKALSIFYSINDIDYPCYINITHNINDLKAKSNSLVYLELQDLTNQEMTINISETLNPGTHTVHLTAIDDKDKTSTVSLKFEIISQNTIIKMGFRDASKVHQTWLIFLSGLL